MNNELNAVNHWLAEMSTGFRLTDLQENTRPADPLPHTPELAAEIPGRTTDKIETLTRQSEMGIFIFFFSVLHILLHEYTRSEDITITTSSFRLDHQPAGENRLYIRSSSIDTSYRAFLNQIREKVLLAYDNQHYDPGILQEKLSANNLLNPLAKKGIFFGYNNLQSIDDAVNHHVLSIVLVKEPGTAKYRLKLSTEENFIPGYLDTLIHDFICLAGHMVEDLDARIPETRWDKICALPAENYGAAVPLDPGMKILDYFSENVRSRGRQPAVYFKNTRLTYEELDKEATLVADRLINACRTSPGRVIGISLSSGLNLLVAIISALKAGNPVLLIDPSMPGERIDYILKNSGAGAWMINDDNSVSGLKIVSLNYIEEAPVQNKDILFLIYTSGSTGNPKGVMLSARNLINQFIWFRDYFSFQPTDVLPQKAAVTFIDCLTELLFPVTLGASSVYLRPYDAINKNPPDLFHWLREIGATILLSAPSVFDYLAQGANLQELRTLKHLVLGGEELTQSYDYHFATYNLYGNSECASVSTIFEIGKGRQFNKIPIGKPIYNTAIYILDENRGPVGNFATGEIYIGGAGVSAGYLNDSELTAERFVPDPFTGHGTMYRTGDLGRRLPDGNIEYIGRTDNRIKIRGIRIDLNEIEISIRERFNFSAVMVIATGALNEKYLVAFYLPQRGTVPPPEKEIKLTLSKSLPPWMIPARFILLDRVPLTLSGKVDRQKLLQLLSTGKDNRSVAPSNEFERMLLDILKDVLKKDDIGVTDNFFTLGGHSLNMVQVLYRIKRECSLEIEPNEFTRSPTIKDLADVLVKTLDTRIDKSPGMGLSGMNEQLAGNPDLVIFHAINGIGIYKGLGLYLNGKQNVYGMTAQGILDGAEELPASLEAMAHYYADAIISSHLTSGLRLVGYSSSVPICYEVAKTLESRGIAVTKAILVDDYFKACTRNISPEEQESLIHTEITATISNLLQLDREIFSRQPMISIDEIFEKYSDKQSRIMNYQADEIKRYIHVIRNIFRCQLAYRPTGHIRAPISYLYSEQYGMDHSWQPYTTAAYNCVKVEGDHDSIFSATNIGKNSLIIGNC